MAIYIGDSISTDDHQGTVGFFVRSTKHPGELFLASAWHVIVGSSSSRKIDVYQNNITRIGAYEENRIPLQDGYDIAFVTLGHQQEVFNITPEGNQIAGEPMIPYLGQRLVMYGAVSHRVEGVIRQIKPYLFEQRHAIEIEVLGDLPEYGDSGALWFDSENNFPVAYHIHKHLYHERSIVAGNLRETFMQPKFQQFELSFI